MHINLVLFTFTTMSLSTLLVLAFLVNLVCNTLFSRLNVRVKTKWCPGPYAPLAYLKRVPIHISKPHCAVYSWQVLPFIHTWFEIYNLTPKISNVSLLQKLLCNQLYQLKLLLFPLLLFLRFFGFFSPYYWRRWGIVFQELQEISHFSATLECEWVSEWVRVNRRERERGRESLGHNKYPYLTGAPRISVG